MSTQNCDADWIRVLLMSLSEELGDGGQKDQHEFLTLFLERLKKVIILYKYRT